jgi:hypothetical protein
MAMEIGGAGSRCKHRTSETTLRNGTHLSCLEQSVAHSRDASQRERSWARRPGQTQEKRERVGAVQCSAPGCRRPAGELNP